MYKNLPGKNLIRGQLILGILIAMAIFLILAHALFTLVSSSFELVSFNKARITARHIAQEKMELVRNLAYDDVATIGGIPNGTVIPQTENIARNGLNFEINTSIIYIDDPFNGSGPPNDTDYKRVRVEVAWQGIAQSRKNPVVLVSDISQNATGTTDGGSLVILVFDSNGDPVPQADVTITTSGVSPAVNLSLQTDNDGQIVLPGATPCVSCYRIVATKSGYSTDRTYATSEVANPIKPDTSVFTDSVTQISFAIDTLGIINISSFGTRESGFPVLGNVPFRIRGNKIIGTDTSAQLVYKFDTTTSTNASGTRNFADMEWDVYHITMPESTSYDVSGTSPLLPIVLSPGGTPDFSFSASPHTAHSFFLTIKDPSQNLIASASATLSDGVSANIEGFSGESGNTDEGQILFSDLTETTYQLTATASGFLNYTGNFDVTGYTVSEVVMTPE